VAQYTDETVRKAHEAEARRDAKEKKARDVANAEKDKLEKAGHTVARSGKDFLKR
jgi:hypothetical protein